MSNHQLLRYLATRQFEGRNSGFSLVETLLVVVVIGVLAAFSSPLWQERPLQAGANQTGSLFRQIRMRAIANTTAFRVRPDPSSVIAGTQQATRFLVEAVDASTSRSNSCGVITNISNLIPPSLTPDNNSRLPVNSVNGFAVGAKVRLANDATNYEITAVDTGNPTIIVGSNVPGGPNANTLLGARVELVTNWRSAGSVTGFLTEELALPGNTNEQIAMATQARTPSGQNIPWSICVNAQGMANFYNTDTGQIINENFILPLNNCRKNTDCAGTNVVGSTRVEVSRGGAVTVPKTPTPLASP